jgi:DNA processing protein
MGIVGSRHMTSYGHRVVEKIVPNLVLDGWTIVSGLMYGIDQTAHEVCLDCGGRTIAVLGWGINYPAGDKERQLQDKIAHNHGLVLSLWESQAGTSWTFPVRNKVVAEICHELIVVEAAAKSGALSTADIVSKLGKKVWAVPGPITSNVSVGTNNLISKGQAIAWLSRPTPNQTLSPVSSLGKSILNLLTNEDLEAGEIARLLNLPIEQVGSELSLLLLSGRLSERNGKYQYAG